MKSDMHDLKKLVVDLLQKGYDDTDLDGSHASAVQKLYQSVDIPAENPLVPKVYDNRREDDPLIQDTEEVIEESLSLEDKEIEMIKKALDKYHGKRKQAAIELGISERTLYRKIKEYDLT